MSVLGTSNGNPHWYGYTKWEYMGNSIWRIGIKLGLKINCTLVLQYHLLSLYCFRLLFFFFCFLPSCSQNGNWIVEYENLKKGSQQLVMFTLFAFQEQRGTQLPFLHHEKGLRKEVWCYCISSPTYCTLDWDC